MLRWPSRGSLPKLGRAGVGSSRRFLLIRVIPRPKLLPRYLLNPLIRDISSSLSSKSNTSKLLWRCSASEERGIVQT